MYTGIIDHCGTITQVQHLPGSRRIWLTCLFADLALGESIAMNGICVTATQIQENTFCIDLSPETLKRTTANDFKVNQAVNLERSLQLSSRLGGHIVMGHVDQTCRVKMLLKHHEFLEMRFAGLNADTRKYVIKKGSIAVDGISLTINEVFDDGFSVMLVPHTLERTNLSLLQENDKVNIEFDMLARIFVEQCQHYLTTTQPTV